MKDSLKELAKIPFQVLGSLMFAIAPCPQHQSISCEVTATYTKIGESGDCRCSNNGRTDRWMGLVDEAQVAELCEAECTTYSWCQAFSYGAVETVTNTNCYLYVKANEDSSHPSFDDSQANLNFDCEVVETNHVALECFKKD